MGVKIHIAEHALFTFLFAIRSSQQNLMRRFRTFSDLLLPQVVFEVSTNLFVLDLDSDFNHGEQRAIQAFVGEGLFSKSE